MFVSKGTWLKSSDWKKKGPWKSCVGISVMDIVNSLCIVKSKPTGFCFVEVSSKDAWEHLLCLVLLHLAAQCLELLADLMDLLEYLECCIQVKEMPCTLRCIYNRAFAARQFSNQYN